MSSLKPIHLYSHASGPNPWKVAIILEELGLPYETELVDMAVMKEEPFVSINPNGRVPAIEDPNTSVKLWESGAINDYLVDTYDKEKKLTYTTSPEKYQVTQWLMFQMSGQGPYYGQAVWFGHFHSEKVPSATERYLKEVERVMGVLNGAVKKTGWLVGNKCTFADLAFVTWHEMVPFIDAEGTIDVKGKYPDYDKWMETMMARPAVKKVLEDKRKAMSESEH